MSGAPERERALADDDDEARDEPLEEAHARADALTLRIAELDAKIDERRRAVDALASAPERSAMERHRERVKQLESSLARARADRDAALRALPERDTTLVTVAVGVVLFVVLVGVLWWMGGGLDR